MTENETYIIIVRALSRKASEEELQQLKDWLDSDAANKKEFEQCKKLWNALSLQRDSLSDIELEKQRQTLVGHLAAMHRDEKLSLPKKKTNYFWRAAAAIALVVVVGSGVLLWRHFPSTDAQGDQQAWVEQRGNVELILSDGDRIDLNRNDSISATAIEQGIGLSQGSLDYTEVHTSDHEETLYNEVATRTGSTYHLTLADGTQVWLNAQSDLRFPVQFEGQERRVYLQGEAYFEVAKDAKHPFIVSTQPGMEVKVYGTHFDIDAYEIDQLRTTLLEGSVGICDVNHKNEYKLTPGQSAVLNALNGQIDIDACNVEDYLQWRDGLIAFYDMPLDNVMKRIGRLHDIEVYYENDSVKKIALSGMLHDSDQLDELLETLATVSGLKFELSGRKVTIGLSTN